MSEDALSKAERYQKAAKTGRMGSGDHEAGRAIASHGHRKCGLQTGTHDQHCPAPRAAAACGTLGCRVPEVPRGAISRGRSRRRWASNPNRPPPGIGDREPCCLERPARKAPSAREFGSKARAEICGQLDELSSAALLWPQCLLADRRLGHWGL